MPLDAMTIERGNLVIFQGRYNSFLIKINIRNKGSIYMKRPQVKQAIFISVVLNAIRRMAN